MGMWLFSEVAWNSVKMWDPMKITEMELQGSRATENWNNGI